MKDRCEGGERNQTCFSNVLGPFHEHEKPSCKVRRQRSEAADV